MIDPIAKREVDIPADILVRCPLANFDLRRAQHCDACMHCAGLTQLQERGPFHARYQVRCKWPQDRQLMRLAPEPCEETAKGDGA